MPLLTTLGFAASAAGAVKGLIGGSKISSDARKGLQNLEFQDLSIGSFDRMKASMEAEKRALEKSAEMRFGAVDLAQGLSGSEAMNFLSAMEERIGEKEKDVLDSLIKEEARIAQIQGQDRQQRTVMQEQRDMQELQSLQQQLQAGEQMQASALQGLGETAMAAGLGKMQMETQAGKDPLANRQARLAKRAANKAAGTGFLGKNTGFVKGLGGAGKLLGGLFTGKQGGKGGILGFIKGLLPF